MYVKNLIRTLSNIGLSKDHKWISGEILTHKQVPIIWFIIFLKNVQCLMGRVFANGPRDQGSIPRRIIPKTQKMVLDATLLNTHYYKIWIK